jgi:hypothetical protein
MPAVWSSLCYPCDGAWIVVDAPDADRGVLKRRCLLKVKIAGIKLANLRQPVPIPDREYAVPKIYASGGAQSLESAIDRRNCHAQCLAQLNQAERQIEPIMRSDPRGTSTVE